MKLADISATTAAGVTTVTVVWKVLDGATGFDVYGSQFTKVVGHRMLNTHHEERNETMKKLLRRKTIIVGAVLAALAAAGIAYATIPDANGVYTACKLNATGTIRLIDPSVGTASLLGHCTSLETQISWNQKGQQGPAGPQGPAGEDGTNGAAAGYSVSRSWFALPGGNGTTAVMQVALGAGSYIFTGSVTAEVTSGVGSISSLECFLTSPEGQIGTIERAWFEVNSYHQDKVNLSVTGGATLAQAETVSVQCSNPYGDNVSVYGDLTAVEVATLN
jgi:hypothetical protein